MCFIKELLGDRRHFSFSVAWFLNSKWGNECKKIYLDILLSNFLKLSFMEKVLNPRSHDAASHSKLYEFFVDQLQDIYWAEKKLVKTLPKLADAASSIELKQAFKSHLLETKDHVSRLEHVFENIHETAKTKECKAIEGITEEGEEIIEETEENTAQRDVGLIFAGQKAEHYEIATYGGLIQVAKTLGLQQEAELLHATLMEEKKADKTLTQIAEGSVNERAASEIKEK
jgi:ferritin-like metal-binding protein YciE